ncbi:MAG TPA: glycosyltransferase family 1 protein [Vicinamibacterales bacterium]
MPRPDLVCFSHLRWNFVWQRPQHLMTRAAATRRVWFVEEPIHDDGPTRLEIERGEAGVSVVIPVLPPRCDAAESVGHLAALLQRFFESAGIEDPVLWYYTPMARAFSSRLPASAVVYDCMDELSAFAGAPPALRDWERDLLARADVVFTGGASLFEAKRALHPNVHAFPSAVDLEHFRRARRFNPQPEDQRGIPRPRIGFYGVLDERLDRDLLREMARLRPGYHFVLLGPVVKIDPASLPAGPNIHYLGMKKYEELPAYLAGWDVAMLPFAKNDATRFISPTKTPEYLAAGCPVVSTSIRDVVRPYGDRQYARIADTPRAFVEAISAALNEDHAARCGHVDTFLATLSWDRTWDGMHALISQAESHRRRLAGVGGRERPPAARAAGPAL